MCAPEVSSSRKQASKVLLLVLLHGAPCARYNLKPLACAVCPPSTTAGQLLDAHTQKPGIVTETRCCSDRAILLYTGDGERGRMERRWTGYGGLQLCALNGRKLVSPAGSPRSSGYRLSGAAPEALVFIMGYTF